MTTRHRNKQNKKSTHIERKDVKLGNAWFLKYQECIIERREVWIGLYTLPRHNRQIDLVTF